MELKDILKSLLEGGADKLEKQIPSSSNWGDDDTTNFFEDDNGNRWFAPTLWAAAKNLPVESIPFLDIFDPKEWQENLEDELDGESDEMIEDELARIVGADLSFPIILDPDGEICDGCHRAMKAFILNHKTISAVQLLEMPEPDEIVEPDSY